MIGRRDFLGLAASIAAGACSSTERSDQKRGSAAAGDGKLVSGGQPRLRLTALHVPGALCHVSLRVAHARGFFEAEGLDVDLLPLDPSHTHDHTPVSVIGPNGPLLADVTLIEYPALVDMALGQLDYYVVAGEHSGCRQLLVPASSSVRSVADLKGKRIGLWQYNNHVEWDYLIRQAGVAPESVQWVEWPTAAMRQHETSVEFFMREFATGGLDAYVVGDPFSETLKDAGVARLLASNTWTSPLSGWYCCMVAVRREVIDAHPEVAGAVTRAFRRSAAFIEQDPAAAVALSIKPGHMGDDTPRDISARLLSEYVWTATGRIEEDLERYFQLLIEAGRLPASAVPIELVRRVYRSGE